MTTFLFVLLLVLGSGLVIKFGLKRFGFLAQIEWKEYAIGAAICALIVLPTVLIVGNNLAKTNLLRYNEFWNGYETQAIHSVEGCSRDGSCENRYNCDPYEVAVYHSAVTDSKGNTISPAYTTYETHYHHCPVATEEHNFYVDTTLGKYTIATGWLSDHPVAWRGSHGIDGAIPRGIPPFWQAASDRIKAQDPGPVTVVKQYDNYILASQHTILKQYSTAVEKYGKKKLLPAVPTEIHDLYLSHKAVFVGKTPTNAQAWEAGVDRFNAAFGSFSQGDLHVVIVNAKVDPDEYTNSLEAYWTGPTFGRHAVSKNSLNLVLGSDGQNVTWARAFTGMPVGNENLEVSAKSAFKGLRLDPDVLLGHPKIVKTKLVNSEGVLDTLVWGQPGFHRVCMTCRDDGKKQGFTYLGGEIRPSAGQRHLIEFVAFFLSLTVWGIFVIVGPTNSTNPNNKEWN